MRLQIVSDLHLERACTTSRYGPLRYVSSDALILAGDIDRIDRVCQRFSDWPCPVLYVRGNHDSFFTPYEAGIRRVVSQSQDQRFQFLERDVAMFDGVRVLGCCLWTDFALHGRPEDALLLAAYCGPDYRFLRRTDGVLMRPEDTQREHRLAVQWLEGKLRASHVGKTVVVTHHAPHARSLDPRFGNSRFDAAFASDLSSLMKRVDVWIHGHVHCSCDYKVKQCRVVCNPAGQPAKPNPHFNPALVIDV
jgi:predicted phosphodiesterase